MTAQGEKTARCVYGIVAQMRGVIWRLSFIFLSTSAITIGPLFVHYVGRDKEMLPTSSMILVLDSLLASVALNYSFWPSQGAGTLRLSWFQFLRYNSDQKNWVISGS